MISILFVFHVALVVYRAPSEVEPLENARGKHLSGLVDFGTVVPTACGKAIPVWERQHADDAAILADWASHFRRHYCSD